LIFYHCTHVGESAGGYGSHPESVTDFALLHVKLH